ncbi:MAG: hypothetical protein IPL74_08015 [Bacteroidetes bacterium]|nr:hypothetical protein [Bacteroidota bacterium]
MDVATPIHRWSPLMPIRFLPLQVILLFVRYINNVQCRAGYSSHQWSNGASIAIINPATAGTYTVTVTDANGCTGTTAATITVNPLPTPAITGVTSFCQGLNSNLNAGPGYGSYLWNTGATSQLLNVSTSGNYTVTVTNGFGCTASANTAVVVNLFLFRVINGPQALCIGSSGTLNPGSGYASYLWNNGSVTQTINVSSAGNWAVTVTSNAGCTETTSSTMVINPLPTPAITGVYYYLSRYYNYFRCGVPDTITTYGVMVQPVRH